MYRQLVYLRKAFKYFDSNKAWILSSLFVFSIIRECVWYACFGINILSFSTIQDTFISFFNNLISFVILPLIYIFLSFFIFNNPKRKVLYYLQAIIITLIFALLAWIYFMLFKKAMSFITVLLFLYLVNDMIQQKKYLNVSRFALLFLIVISLFEPLLQYQKIKHANNIKKRTIEFYYEEGNMEFLSFKYNEKTYDTKNNRYFLVGNTSTYLFLFDNQVNKTLVFSKDECENIECEVF